MTASAGSYERMSDANLVISIGRYDQSALAEIYRRHAGPVFGLASRLLQDRTLAEDVVQTVFVRLWERPERFDPVRGALRSFLLSDTHGRAVDLIRMETARRRREDRVEAHEVHAGYDLEREVADLATADQVKAALAQLTDNERRAIELAYFHGHSYQEVAVELDEPEGTVKSRIRAGLKKMRVNLVDAGTEAPS
jgi:RNA polymerase sigma-70 factor, ECF subfamily